MVNLFQVIVTDVEKAGEAVVHEIEALPSQVEHALADLFKWTATKFGPAAVQAAVTLAESYLNGKATGVVQTIVTDVEKSDAIAWVKGELLNLAADTGSTELSHLANDVLSASSLASLALGWVTKGLSVITTAETDAGIGSPPTP